MNNTIEIKNIINNFDIEVCYIDNLFIDNKTLVHIRQLYKNGYITKSEYETLYKTVINQKIS